MGVAGLKLEQNAYVEYYNRKVRDEWLGIPIRIHGRGVRARNAMGLDIQS